MKVKTIIKNKTTIKTLIAALTLTICFSSLIHPLQNREIKNIEIKIETRGVQVTVPIGQIINEVTEPFITPISLILTLFITTKTLDLTEKLMKDILKEKN